MILAEIELLVLLNWFALAGITVFAVSGTLQGLRQEMDIVGVSLLAALSELVAAVSLRLAAIKHSWHLSIPKYPSAGSTSRDR